MFISIQYSINFRSRDYTIVQSDKILKWARLIVGWHFKNNKNNIAYIYTYINNKNYIESIYIYIYIYIYWYVRSAHCTVNNRNWTPLVYKHRLQICKLRFQRWILAILLSQYIISDSTIMPACIICKHRE